MEMVDRRMVTVEVANAVRDYRIFAGVAMAGAWAQAEALYHKGERTGEGGTDSWPHSDQHRQSGHPGPGTPPDEPATMMWPQ